MFLPMMRKRWNVSQLGHLIVTVGVRNILL